MISALAARQHGVVSRAQLLAAGVTRHQIATRVRHRRLHELHRGVYLVGHAVPPRYAPEMAALLACGPNAVLSHTTAASLWNLLPYPARGLVCIAIPPGQTRNRPGLRIHRSAVRTRDIRHHQGLTLTSPPRTLVDLASELGPEDLEHLVAEAHYRHLASEDELRDQLYRNPHKPGVANLRRVLDLPGGPRRTRSPGERAMLRLLRRAGIAGFETNARVAGYEVDFLWRQERFVLEVDGYDAHSGRAAFERDRLKVSTLIARGHRVMLGTGRQIRDDPDVACSPGWRKRDHEPMRAMVLEQPGAPLVATEMSEPEPGPGQVAARVLACGVCRTDLHVVDGELPDPKLPLILGHQIVGEVVANGDGAGRFAAGDRVGIPWLGWTCGECRFCASGRENLCERALFTGYTLDGGYAERAVADERYCIPLAPEPAPTQLAPLLCAGLIGYRALRMCGDAERLGLYGFGASAHIICQVAAHQGRRVFAVTKQGDSEKQAFARELGAEWAGGADEVPEELDAAIIFAPAGELVTVALRSLAPGGAVVCAGIHMSDIPSFPYADLWRERQIRSVANLTRLDGEEFLPLASEVPVRTQVTTYPLAGANAALEDLRSGRLVGSAVLTVAA